MKTSYPIRNITELRADFWREHPTCTQNIGNNRRALPQNLQPADTRSAFVDYVDQLARSGSISPRLAESATL